MSIYDLLELDDNGIPFLDSRKVNIESFKFPEIKKSYQEKRTFFEIEGIDDYIVKDTTMVPLLFNRTINKKLLANLIDRQPVLPDVGFPIGYYKKHGLMNGTIIPYYKDAACLRNLIYINKFEDLKKFYNRCDDDIDNLINMLVDIIRILSKLQENDIYYTDTNSGNFVIHNNEVKIIDFDPGFVFFKDKDFKHYDRILLNYADLVELVLRRYGFKNILFNREDTFAETAGRVKSLRKELKGQYNGV